MTVPPRSREARRATTARLFEVAGALSLSLPAPTSESFGMPVPTPRPDRARLSPLRSRDRVTLGAPINPPVLTGAPSCGLRTRPLPRRPPAPGCRVSGRELRHRPRAGAFTDRRATRQPLPRPITTHPGDAGHSGDAGLPGTGRTLLRATTRCRPAPGDDPVLGDMPTTAKRRGRPSPFGASCAASPPATRCTPRSAGAPDSTCT